MFQKKGVVKIYKSLSILPNFSQKNPWKSGVTELTFNSIAGSLLHVTLLKRDLLSMGSQTIKNNYFLEHLKFQQNFTNIFILNIMQIDGNKQTKFDAQNLILIQCCAGTYKDFKRGQSNSLGSMVSSYFKFRNFHHLLCVNIRAWVSEYLDITQLLFILLPRISLRIQS